MQLPLLAASAEEKIDDRQTDKVLGKAFNLNTKTFVCVLFPKAKRAKKSETLRSV